MSKPWVSFCISTFKRPQFLHQQLSSLLRQDFTDFEIVISDNDPERSAESVVLQLKDPRLKYFPNKENMGMVKSFNRSVERSETDYIVMVTDDDPIDQSFLAFFHELYVKYPGYSIYCGFERKTAIGEIEFVDAKDFVKEVLDWDKTPWLLWSSTVMRKDAAISIGIMPDYGSPHLADHAMIALTGSVAGGIIVNKKFSSLTSHDSNFSKRNFDMYYTGCAEFYNYMRDHDSYFKENRDIILKHLYKWFIGISFNLKRYYTVTKPNKEEVEQINEFSRKILSLPFMKKLRRGFTLKSIVFSIKKQLGMLKSE